jgi:hypothetical protein
MSDEARTPPGDEDRKVPRSGEELEKAVRRIINKPSEEGGEAPGPADGGSPPSDEVLAGDLPGPVDDEPPVPLTDTRTEFARTPRSLPRTEAELRVIVREIVTDVLRDVQEVRRAASEPVEVVSVPRMLLPRIRLSWKQIAAVAATLIVLIGGPVAWLSWPRNVELPDGAVGLWTTVAPRYADRAFRLTKSTVTFHVSPEDSTFHQIVRIRSEEDQEDNATRYTILYTHYHEEYEFSFLYTESPDTIIRFVNQREMTWRKTTS